MISWDEAQTYMNKHHLQWEIISTPTNGTFVSVSLPGTDKFLGRDLREAITAFEQRHQLNHSPATV